MAWLLCVGSVDCGKMYWGDDVRKLEGVVACDAAIKECGAWGLSDGMDEGTRR